MQQVLYREIFNYRFSSEKEKQEQKKWSLPGVDSIKLILKLKNNQKGIHEMEVKSLPSWLLFVAINFGFGVPLTGATKSCESFRDCVIFSGYTCKNNKCVCESDESGYYRCIPPKYFGERCNSDQECLLGDYHLYCMKDIRLCKCKRGFFWDIERRKCLSIFEEDFYTGPFDPVKDLIIPTLILVTISAMVYLGFKLFCNCGKLLRRRRHQEIARELEEISNTSHQPAWIASYRVFSPYNNSTRSSSTVSPTSFPLHPTPCMGLFVPSQLGQSPPSYEEALKHKVILSSYHNAGPHVVPVPVPAYTLPPPDVPRQYQTLPPNASGSSSIILHPSIPNPSSFKVPTMSAHRSYPIVSNEHYETLPIPNEWTQLQHSGTTGQLRNPHHLSSSCSTQEIATQSETSETLEQHSRLHPTEVYPPISRNHQIMSPQPRSGLYRSGQPQKIYHSSDSPRTVLNTERNI